MGRFILGVVVVLLAAGQAGAQITGGPTGPLVMVDDTGKKMGTIAGAVGEQSIRIAIDTPQGPGFIRLRAGDTRVGQPPIQVYSVYDQYYGEGILFSGSHCTGLGYVRPAYEGFRHGPPIYGGSPALHIYQEDSLLYAVSGPAVEATVKSYEYYGCQNYSETQGVESVTDQYLPLTYVGDLSAEFTPPFHIAVLDDPEWIPAGIPLPEWFGILVVGFLFGAYYMKGKYDGRVVA